MTDPPGAPTAAKHARLFKAILALLALLVVVETARLWLARIPRPPPASTPIERDNIRAYTPLYKPDRLLGYSLIPGVHVSIYEVDGEKREVVEIIGPDGNRTTSSRIAPHDGRPEIWILGCSFSYGDQLSNHETFPWILQESLPGYKVRNLAVCAYSTLHALLQLRRSVEEGEAPPRICVVSYNSFHIDRNVGASDWLQALRGWASPDNPGPIDRQAGTISYPAAELEGSELKIRYIPIDEQSEEWHRALAKPLPDRPAMLAVTNKILDEIMDLCVKRGTRVVLAVQSEKNYPGTMLSRVVNHARALGFEIVDVSVRTGEDAPATSLWGRYFHPNHEAHKAYATGLLEYLKLPTLP